LATLSVIHFILPLSPPLSLSAVSKRDTTDKDTLSPLPLIAPMSAMRPPQGEQNNMLRCRPKRDATQMMRIQTKEVARIESLTRTAYMHEKF